MSKTAVRWSVRKPVQGASPAAQSAGAERAGTFAIHAVDERAVRVQPVTPQSPQSSSMAEQGLVAAEIAHDLSNTLGAVRLHLDLLELETEKTEKVSQRLRELRLAVEHASAMTRQLIDPDRLNPAMIDRKPGREVALNPVLRRIAPLLSNMLPPYADLHLRLAPDLRSVPLGPNEIVRIVSNLVRNAGAALNRSASRSGAQVTIETANWQIPGWVLLRLSDTGIGMSAVTRAAIFQPFFSTKPAGEGRGLGLSSVLRIVQSAGGAIQVESTPGKGTGIAILLPCCDSRSGRQRPEEVRFRKKAGSTAVPQVPSSFHEFGPQRPSR